MANVTLSGILLDPTGEVAVGDQIRFTHRTTTGETIQFARSLLIIPPNGMYNFTLEFGLIFVEYLDVKDVNYKSLGVVTVNGDTTATDLPGLLNAIVPPTDAQLLLFQGILADTEDARDIALLAAAQQTTLQLISSTVIHPAGTVLTLSGYTLSGDGGGAQWKLNGVVGQPVSQSPAQLGDALLNDASGNQWELIPTNGEVDPKQTGAVGNYNRATSLGTDDILAIEAAYAFAVRTGLARVIATPPQKGRVYLHTRPLVGRTDILFLCSEPTIGFFNDDSQGDFWSGSSWLFNSGGGLVVTSGTFFNVTSITKGSKIIALTIAGDFSNFAVGDVISLRTIAEYTIGGIFDHPVYGETNIIAASVSGSLTLKYAVEEDQTSLKIANMTNISYNQGGTLPPTGGAGRGAALSGGIWETNDKHFCTQFYSADLEVHPHAVIGKSGLGFGGGAAHSNMSVAWEEVTDHSYDLATTTNNVKLIKGQIQVDLGGGSVDQVGLFSETCRSCTVEIQTLNVSNGTLNNGIVGVTFGKNNLLTIDKINGDATAPAGAFIQTFDHPGTKPDTLNNIFNLPNIDMDNLTRVARINNTSTGSVVDDNTFNINFIGASVSGDSINCTVNSSGNVFNGQYSEQSIVDSGNNIFRNATDSSIERLKSVEHRLSAFNATFGVDFGDTTTVLANSYTSKSVINLRATFDGNVSAATKTVTISIGGSTQTLTIPIGERGITIMSRIVNGSGTTANINTLVHEQNSGVSYFAQQFVGAFDKTIDDSVIVTAVVGSGDNLVVQDFEMTVTSNKFNI